MAKTRNSQDTFERAATHVLVLMYAAVRTLNALAEDRARAQRAAAMAALPRQRLTELRALYTQDAMPARAWADRATRSAAFEQRSAYGESRSLT